MQEKGGNMENGEICRGRWGSERRWEKLEKKREKDAGEGGKGGEVEKRFSRKRKRWRKGSGRRRRGKI